MKNKNILHFLKRVTALVLVLTIFSVIPKYSRCEEKPADQISFHSIISLPQNIF